MPARSPSQCCFYHPLYHSSPWWHDTKTSCSHQQIPDISIPNFKTWSLDWTEGKRKKSTASHAASAQAVIKQKHKLESAAKRLSHSQCCVSSYVPRQLQLSASPSLHTRKNCRKGDLPGPDPLSLAWLSPNNSFYQPRWATSSSRWSFCWFQIEGGGAALAVLSSKCHSSTGGKRIWKATSDKH